MPGTLTDGVAMMVSWMWDMINTIVLIMAKMNSQKAKVFILTASRTSGVLRSEDSLNSMALNATSNCISKIVNGVTQESRMTWSRIYGILLNGI